VEGKAVEPGFAVREVLLGRDVRAPEILSRSAVSRSYLLRRCASVAGLVLIDLASFGIAALLARHILANEHGPVQVFSALHLLVMAAALVAIFAANQLYGLHLARQNRRRQVSAVLCVLAAALALDRITGAWIPLDIVVGWLICVGLLVAGRESFDACLRVLFGFDLESKRTIVLGSPSSCAALVEWRRRFPMSPRPVVIGLVGDETPDRSWQKRMGIPSLGSLPDIEKIVARTHPDQLVVVDREVEVSHLVELAGLCRRRKMVLKLADPVMRFSDGVCLVPDLAEPLFVSAPPARSGAAWLLKRATDHLLAGCLLVLVSPLLAVLAVAIKATSPGPIIYAAERIGLGQRRFRCYKLRTMRVDAPELQAQLEQHNEADGAMFKIKDDPRVTPLGRWLRALSIDELPQLVNVLRGDMSLVGPRPLPVRDDELLADWHKQRHVVLPGMTGLWQVRGRSDASFGDMIRLDLIYIESWSPWLDLTIFLRTPWAVIGSRGAY
jgi:exopolysaccharide biosynthesis polyprenyl glycosylphosphotransferase